MLEFTYHNTEKISFFPFPYSFLKISNVCALAPSKSDLSHVER